MATYETCFSDGVFNRSPLVKSVHWVHLLGFGGFGGVFFAEIVLEGMSSTGSSLGISLK